MISPGKAVLALRDDDCAGCAQKFNDHSLLPTEGNLLGLNFEDYVLCMLHVV